MSVEAGFLGGRDPGDEDPMATVTLALKIDTTRVQAALADLGQAVKACQLSDADIDTLAKAFERLSDILCTVATIAPSRA